MWPFLGVAAVSLLIAAMEMPALRRNGSRKELWVFLSFLAVGFALSTAECFRVKLSNPLDWITYVYKPFSEALFGWLK